jgi:hypothetical protein
MGLSIRPYIKNGEKNPSRTVIRSQDNSEDGKKLLMEFTRRSGIKTLCHGKERQRYTKGNCHYLVFVNTADLNKAKVKAKAKHSSLADRKHPSGPFNGYFYAGIEAAVDCLRQLGYNRQALDVSELLLPANKLPKVITS